LFWRSNFNNLLPNFASDFYEYTGCEVPFCSRWAAGLQAIMNYMQRALLAALCGMPLWRKS
jgi:hypothetical protein